MDQQRALLPNIQILRGLAALIVAISHLSAALAHAEISNTLPDFTFGNSGVDLFFVVSGFIMFHTAGAVKQGSESATRFLARRLIRVVPIYWIFTSLTLALVLHEYRHVPMDTFQRWHSVASYLFIPFQEIEGQSGVYPIYAVGWTLQYEMLFYICFTAAIFLKPRFRLATLSCFLMIAVILGQTFDLPLPLSFWAAPILLEFVFGMLVAWVYRRGSKIAVGPAIALAIIAVAGILAYARYTGGSDDWRAVGWGVPSATLVSVATLLHRSNTNMVTRALELLGDASYSLYLIHPIIYEGLIETFRVGILAHRIDLDIFSPAMLVGAVAAALAFYHLVERPLTRALQKRFLGRTSVVPAAA